MTEPNVRAVSQEIYATLFGARAFFAVICEPSEDNAVSVPVAAKFGADRLRLKSTVPLHAMRTRCAKGLERTPVRSQSNCSPTMQPDTMTNGPRTCRDA